MTQLALVERKINFASDKQINRVIICTYIDKEREHLELSHARIPHTLHAPQRPQKGTSLFACDTGALAPRSLTLCWCPDSPPWAETARQGQGTGATFLFGFPQTDWRNRRLAELSRRPVIVPLIRTPCPRLESQGPRTSSPELVQVLGFKFKARVVRGRTRQREVGNQAHWAATWTQDPFLESSLPPTPIPVTLIISGHLASSSYPSSGSPPCLCARPEVQLFCHVLQLRRPHAELERAACLANSLPPFPLHQAVLPTDKLA